ncbi:hypothetical protein Smlt0599 [Stenotrophomonas maltophilia K279a]|uniref:Uncharacterized protein n=1 Tax=Stenotrophomonas maltophilia (strain K279a) TaxID=522373 RepID=B2FLT2_STRMK|nr:hypothetical protein Smlt0599 [Stenotrophomonas maltophilia K279a]
MPGVCIEERFLVWIRRELKGPAGTGRGLGKCPPAPAVGRHLLLYFAQTPARPDEARRAVRKAQHARPPFKEAPTNSERRADALA